MAHIEFNAINLALDAVWRFAGMPEAYYRDWLRVAAEEALHFTLLRDHLQASATTTATSTPTTACGRWPSARPTTSPARMALVPRTLEARGLDATPPMQAQLREGRRRARGGDPRRSSCATRSATWPSATAGTAGCASATASIRWRTTPELAARYGAPRLRPPFNLEARRDAGFTAAEIAALDSG